MGDVPIDFHSLPANALAKIYTFLDNKSIARMFQVSKSLKNILHYSWLYSQKTVVSTLLLTRQEDRNKKIIMICFAKLWVSYVWKSCFEDTFNKLKISKTEFEYKNSDRTYALSATLNAGELRQFFECIKPLTQKTTFQHLHIAETESSIIRMCTPFLEGNSFNSVFIGPRRNEPVDFCALLELVDQVKPGHIDYSTYWKPLEKDSIEFLWQLSNMVKSLWIFVETKTACTHPNITSVILPMLTRKCEMLEINANCAHGLISQADIEMLLQVLHHSNQKMSLTTYTNVGPMNDQFGEYKVHATDHGMHKRRISIKHAGLI